MKLKKISYWVHNMEMEKELCNQTPTKLFTFLLTILLAIVLGICGILFWISFSKTTAIYQLIIFISTIILLTIGVVTCTMIVAIIFLARNKKMPCIIKNLMESFLHFSYPTLIFLGKTVGFDKDLIRRAYTNLNNQLVLDNAYGFKGEEILILTPHCIQKSFCPHKITNDTNNCKRCGQCNVDKLLDLKEEYGVEFRIVTGGTLARKIIKNMKPKAIIAIACERDLISGLMDVRKIPIIAIINKRPQGPCLNTEVDLREVERAIIHFIKE